MRREREIVDDWGELMELFESGSMSNHAREQAAGRDEIFQGLVHLGNKIEGLPEKEEENWNHLDQLLFDTMKFIDNHLAREEEWGEVVALASLEKLKSGMLILSVLRETVAEFVTDT